MTKRNSINLNIAGAGIGFLGMTALVYNVNTVAPYLSAVAKSIDKRITPKHVPLPVETALAAKFKAVGYKGAPFYENYGFPSSSEETGVDYRTGEQGRYAYDQESKTHFYIVVNESADYASGIMVSAKDDKAIPQFVGGSDSDRAVANMKQIMRSFTKDKMPNIRTARQIAQP